MTVRRHDFDEALISGFLDGELTQADMQRVRVHLQDCAECRATADELSRLRETTMGSQFQLPPDTGWEEAPRGGTSRLLRSAGIVIGLAWIVGVLAFILVEMANEDDLAGLLFIGGLLLAGGLLTGSVLLDRRAELRNDRYRRVKK